MKNWLHTLQKDSGVIYRFIRFAAVGVFSSLLYIFLVMLCVEVLHLNNTLAAAVAYVLSVPLNYIAHRKISFRSVEKKKQELPKFLFLHLVNMAISMGGMFGAVSGLGLPYWAGAASAAILVPISTFLAMQFWVFKAASAGD